MPIRYRLLIRRFLLSCGVLAIVAAVTAANFQLFRVNNATAALSYLLIILGVATKADLAESLVACGASVICYNFFFLPPIWTLTIADPQNWVALCVFLITAITASKLSTSARQKADEAGARRQDMERLYQFSRALMLGDNEQRLSSRIAQQVATIFLVPSVDFYEAATDTVFHAGQTQLEDSVTSLMRRISKSGEVCRTNQHAAVHPVRLGGRTIGSLSLAGVYLSDMVLSAICQLAAISLERARAQEVINRDNAMRENEQLKSTLLDALAHEFKTPLTSIKAAISAVLSQRSHDKVESELLTIVDEEADHLTNLVTESIQIARIGTGQVKLHMRPYSPAKLVASAISDLRALCDGREIRVDVDNDLPALRADPELAGLALRQLIGNALKYAPPSAGIAVSAENLQDFVVIHVANEGPSIPANEHEAIFEKFYRGREARDRVPGTGMGLTISRDIVQAHGGILWLASESPTGVRFSFTLPTESTVNLQNGSTAL